MDSTYCSKIDLIRKEIKTLNMTMSDKETYTLEKRKPKASDDPEYRSFALKKFQSTINYKTFKRREKEALRKMNAKYETVEKTIDDMDEFQNQKIETEMKRIGRWNRLDKWQKNNRIEDFLKRYAIGDNFVYKDDKGEIHIKLDDMKKALIRVKTRDIIWKEGIIQDINSIRGYL
tara:strand:+ start:100 stop:624 length:525 start_codon:yes stop_codon:yes gene_type:complete